MTSFGNTNISIPVDSIVSATEIAKNYSNISKNVTENGIGYVFKNNKPDKVLMDFKVYSEMMELIEHHEIYNIVEKRKNNDENLYDLSELSGLLKSE